MTTTTVPHAMTRANTEGCAYPAHGNTQGRIKNELDFGRLSQAQGPAFAKAQTDLRAVSRLV